MSQPIRTMWHKIIPLIDADNVWLTAPIKNGKVGQSRHWNNYTPRPNALKEVVRELGKLPKFVIDDELIEIICGEGFQQSILAMQRAGVLRLPFPAITIEFRKDSTGGRALVLLRDNAFPERLPWEAPLDKDNGDFWRKSFYGIPFRIEADRNGEYLVISPGVVSSNVEEKDGKPWLEISAQGHDILKNSPELSDLIRDTYVKEGALIWRALAAAFLITHTGGVTREVVECAKINRKRLLSNKEPIPRHIVLSIGKVYRSSKSETADDYIPGRSPRPHWRRGYDQPVRYGKGHTLTKLVYVPGKLVAFKEFEGAVPPPAPEYHVKP